MLKKLFVLLVLLSIAAPCFADRVDTAWVRRYNGPANDYDEALALAVDDSGNVYITGSSRDSVTFSDYTTIKYYPSGDTAWLRRYSSPGYNQDGAHALAVDDSGNVYVTGEGSGTFYDYVTVKYYSNGDTAWVRRYNGPGNNSDEACAITVDDSGNVYVTGYSIGSGTFRDYATIKYYPDGDTAWVRRYNGSASSGDWALGIAVDDSGNVYVTGYSEETGTYRDYTTIKYHSNGDTAWVRGYNGTGDSTDQAYAIAVDDSGYVYVTGESYGAGLNEDYATVKYHPNGDTAWVRRYNGPGNHDDYACALAVDHSGNVYVTGASSGSGTSLDYTTIKYYPNGVPAWVSRYNGAGNLDDWAYDLAVDNSGNVYVTGGSVGSGTANDCATIKYYPDGDTAWVIRYDGPVSGSDKAYAIAVDNSWNTWITGYSTGSGTFNDYTTIKYTTYPQDPNDPGVADTLYFQAGSPCSSDGDTLYIPPGGGDVTIDINIWNDENIQAIGVPLADSTYGPPSNAFLDSSKNNGAADPLCFVGSRAEHFSVRTCNLTLNPPQVLLGAVSLELDSMPPGDGLFASMVFTVSGEGQICLDTLFFPPVNVLGFVTYPEEVQFTPQFVSKCFYVRQGPLPVPDFAGSPVIGEKSLEVHFTDSSEGEVTSWYWSFGDGYFSQAQNPTHTYSTTGSYDVKLIVTNQYGPDSLIKEDYIQVLAKPQADFTADPTVGAPPLGVQFTDNSIGNVTSWKWYFGDNDSSSQEDPYHEYSSFATYDVTLIATSANGPDTLTKESFIFAYPALSGDSVKVLNVTATPNQEDVVVPVVQSNTDSLTQIWVPLAFDPEKIQIDSVSFAGSRVEGSAILYDTISNDEGGLLLGWVAFPPEDCLIQGQGLFANLYLRVEDVVPPNQVIFDTTTFTIDETEYVLTYIDDVAEPYYPGFAPGSLYVEKTDYTPPGTPQNLVALPLESGISLTWDAVSDPDLRFYAIYRNTSVFTPDSLGDSLATSLEPFYLDSEVSFGVPYFYRVSAVDSSWNESEYSDTASAAYGDTTPPVITLGPTVIAISDTMATIYWETDEEADGYGEIYIDTNWVTADSHMTYLLEHTATVTWLEPSTSYPFRVHSTDSLDNGPTYSESDTLTTATGPDVTPPQIIFGPAAVYVADNSATIEWTTNEIANSRVYYGQDSVYTDSVVDPGFVTSHSLTLTGLSPATTYYYVASSEDPSGNGPTYSGNFYKVGDEPFSVVCGDLDGDSDLDLAVANTGSDNVSVLKNNGDGTFQPKVDYAAGDVAVSVFCADLDGDLDLDLAVANWNSYNVSILKNNGDGTFQPKVDYTSGNNARSVFCADLDGDLDLDLAVADYFSDSVSILKNNGDATFQPKVGYAAGVWPVSVFCADLDGDLDLDLAVVNNSSNNVSILKNNGDATFQSKVDYPAGDVPISVFCADLDGDLDLDLAVGNRISDNVSILKNNGDGTFQPKVDYAAGDYAGFVFCADLDGDLDLDLAVANTNSGNVSILKNNGNGTFQSAVNYGAGDGPRSVFCADLDFDSDLDLAVANASSDNVSILKNNGDGTFAGPDSFTTETAPDSVPPAIVEGPIHSGITDNKAVISWLTDEISTSIVQYGPSELYGSEREESDLVQEHQIVLTDLEDSTLYQYRVGSVDPGSNGPTYSSNFWFWTRSAPDTMPPIILTGPYASWINNTQAQIDWTTDEISDSWVYYGLGGSYDNVAGNPTYVTEHSVVLTNLVPDTTYNYYITSTDPSGNTIESAHTGGGLRALDTGDDQFTTRASPDVTAPVIISGPHVRYKSDDQAMVEWVTDETGNSIVEYGLSQDYGTLITYPEATISHTAYLSNLSPNTTYHFRVGSQDIAKNGPTYGSDVTFTTSADVSDTEPPVITVAPGIAYADESRAIITWETDEPADSYMGYELIDGRAEKVVGESFCMAYHNMTLNLQSSYNVRVFSSDQYGNGPTYSDYFTVTALSTPDVTAPAVTTGPEVIYVSENSAKIGWETDELSSSFVEYGLSDQYTDIEGNPDNDSLHEVILTNLASSTTYHYRIKSADVFGNTYLGSDETFSTASSSDVTPPATPTDLCASYGNQWVRLDWNENSEADLSGYNLYRGTALSVTTLPLIASNLVDSSYRDEGLINGQTYYYQVAAVDRNSNASPPSEIVCSKALSYVVGDFNGDEEIGLVDVVAIINYVFKGAEGREPLEAGNVNCNEGIGITDVVYLINYLFKAGEEPCICTMPLLLARHQTKAKAVLGLNFPTEAQPEIAEVLLQAELEEEVAGIELELSFDHSKLEVQAINTTSRTNKLGLFYNIKSGSVKIGLVDIYGANTLLPGEGPLLEIKLRQTERVSAISSLKIDKAVVANTSAQELEVQIQPNKVLRPVPRNFSLAQNYPNPFNARTIISYSLPEDSKVEITIYNILGQRVKTLMNEYQTAGYKTVVWDGTNEKGSTVASGIYLYRIQAGDFTSSKKMLLLK